MNILKNLWKILTTSKGTKRNASIISMGIVLIAGWIGFDVPDNSEEMATKIAESAAWLFGIYGVAIAKRAEKKKAKMVKKVEENPVVKAANEALK